MMTEALVTFEFGRGRIQAPALRCVMCGWETMTLEQATWLEAEADRLGLTAARAPRSVPVLAEA